MNVIEATKDKVYVRIPDQLRICRANLFLAFSHLNGMD